MRHPLRTVIFLCLTVFVFSSCSNVPEHARYIPNDAIAVVGINAKALGKKVAWNAITGSKLFKQWMHDLHEKSSGELEFGKLGIDGLNTFYLYAKTDKRYKDGNRVTALVPLSSAKDWEAYIKKQIPNLVITQHGNRQEALLSAGMYAGWNNKLLIVMNMLPGTNEMMGMSADSNAKPAMDDASLSAGMDDAFGVLKENALIGNKRFEALQKEDHDVLFWMNYDLLMGHVMSEGLADKMQGVSLSNTLWKDAAFAGGIDFEKGKIRGAVKYYTSEAMKESSKELGSTNVDKDMISRLPMQNLDILMAFHLSPKGLKAMLEKAGLLGFANIALAQQNLNADYIFDAFTGDMTLAINDFALKTETVTDTSFGEKMSSTSMKPSMNALYAIKINKKENFDKLLKMVAENGLIPMGNNMYAMPISETDSVYVVSNGEYALASNKKANVDAYLQGTNKNQKMPADANAVYGHPFSMYLDIQQIGKTIDPGLSHSRHDSAIIIEGKKLLDNLVISGGDYIDNAFLYHIDINFMNKDENSLLEIMDFGMKVNDINNAPSTQTAYNIKGLRPKTLN